MTMHDDEVAIDAELVRRLLAEQIPEFSQLPLREVPSTGTVNAVFRLGDALAARVPRVLRWASDLERELAWLPILKSELTLTVPRPVRTGSPTEYYPMPWAVYEWIDGSPYSNDGVDDDLQAARDLANFVTELQRIDSTGAPPAGRRPLRELDAITRDALAASATEIDAPTATKIWDAVIETPAWTGAPVWIHTDLLPPNLLVSDGRLAAVIDWGGAGIGDPAADVIAAWSVFGAAGRRAFRMHLGTDDETWNRGRGFALHQAALIIPYYRDTNPEFVAMAVRTIQEILSDT